MQSLKKLSRVITIKTRTKIFYNRRNILNKINGNKNSYKVNRSKVNISMLDEVELSNLFLDFTFDTPLPSFAQQPINDLITLPFAYLNINMPQERTDNIINKNYINDTEEINYKNFKDNILWIISKNIEDMKNRKIKLVKKTWEASIESLL